MNFGEILKILFFMFVFGVIFPVIRAYICGDISGDIFGFTGNHLSPAINHYHNLIFKIKI